MILLFIIQMVLDGGKGETVTEVFAVLYRQYLPKIYRYIRFKTIDDDTAEDLTSAVFEKALTRFHAFESKRATFSTWVFTIARNTVIDHFRTSHKELTVELAADDPTPSADASPEAQAIKNEEFVKLQKSMLRLSPAEQSLMSLKFGAHMSNREIARSNGMTESQVGNTIFRAVTKLRNEFKGWRDE